MTRLLSEAAKALDARSTRSRQKKVGASEIGTCRRRAGYRHHGVPYSDPENVSGLKAVHGTWIHKGALETMRRMWGSLIETTVEDDTLRGHIDAIELPNKWRALAGLDPVPDAPDVIEVDDLKTKDDARAIDWVRVYVKAHGGPKRSELYQVHLYADLLRRGMVGPLPRGGRRIKNVESALIRALAAADPADLTEEGGLPVERIRVRYIPRSGHEEAEYPYEQDFDPDIAAEAWEWVAQVTDSPSPDVLPRDQDGPGLSIVCDNCPFLTACWGEDTGVKRQAQLLVTDADLAATLEEYDEQRAIESAAKKAKDYARAKLDATDPAVYTDGAGLAYKLSWTGGREVPASEEPDVEAMLDLYATAGLQVPMREVPGKTTATSIVVIPWTPPDPVCGKPVGDPVRFVPDDDPDATHYLQDRPRGGWTRYRGGEELETPTAGQFRKAYPEYVDPRPPCVLKKGHTGEHADVIPTVVLDLDDGDA